MTKEESNVKVTKKPSSITSMSDDILFFFNEVIY